MPESNCPTHPFNKIALSFSGGGYRAASFHLGTMSYLNRLNWGGTPLLNQVKMISTVSGGTIPGVIYALQKQEDKTFEEIYNFLLDRLENLDLLKESFIKLSTEGIWNNKTKRRNIINAFAEIYDEHYTFGKTLEEFRHLDSHLEALVYNSTEFNNGLNFRFRNKGKFNGSARVIVPYAVAVEIKLSDVLASSSCFPGGFEPMLWPNDFVHADSINLEKHAKNNRTVGLMDGGIYDNQGIESVLKYNSKVGEPYFDLVIVSDVSSPNMSSFKATNVDDTWFSKRTFQDFIKYNVRFNWILIGAIIALMCPLIFGLGNEFLHGICSGLAFSLIAVLIFKVWAIKKVSNKIKSSVEKLVGPNFDFYKSKIGPLSIARVPFGTLSVLLKDRIVSLSILMQEVFLKVVRRLNYNKLYVDNDYKLRRISTLIKCLTEEDFPKYKSSLPDNSTITYDNFVGQRIAQTVAEASSFGTTLWFTETEGMNNVLHKLVATGQLTMCFNMMIYLNKWITDDDGNFDRLSTKDQIQMREMLEQCKGDWVRFKKDPEFMVGR